MGQSPVAVGRTIFRSQPEDIHDREPVEDGAERFMLVGDVRLDNRGELSVALGIVPDGARRMPDAPFLLQVWKDGASRRSTGSTAITPLPCGTGPAGA